MLTTTRNHSTQSIFLAALPVVLAVLFYLPTLNYPFVWDDIPQIVYNQNIRDADNVGTVFFSSTFDDRSGTLRGAFWRPLASLNYMLNYHLWGLTAGGFRLVQILLHGLNTLLAYLLLRRLTSALNPRSSVFIAFWTAVIFAVHPVNIESVVYLGSIGEVLYTFLGLSAILILLGKDRSYSPTAIQTVFFFVLAFAGLLSKESAVALYPLAALCIVLLRKTTRRWWAYYIIGTVVSIATYLYARLGLAGVPFLTDYDTFISEAPLLHRIMTIPYIVLTYLQNLILPLNLHIYQNAVIEIASDFRFWGYAIILATITTSLAFLVYRRKEKKILIVFACWFCVGLLPILNVFGIDMTLADRWLYLPAIGFWGLTLTLLTLSVGDSRQTRWMLSTGLVLWVSIFFITGVVRQNAWSSERALFETDVHYVESSFELMNNYGKELVKDGDYSKGLYYLEESLRINPDWPISRINYATTLQLLGYDHEAEMWYANILRDYQEPIIYSNFASLYINAGRSQEALRVVEAGLERFPRYEQLTALKAYIYLQQGKREEARELLARLYGDKKAAQDLAGLEQAFENIVPQNPQITGD